MRMGRKIMDKPIWCRRVVQQWVRGADNGDLLEIAVRSGMIIWPRYRMRFPIIDDVPCLIRVEIPAVKEVRVADAAKRTHGAPKIHMIAGYQQSAALLTKAPDRLAILRVESVAQVDRKQPELVKVRLIDCRQYRIWRAVSRAIARRHGAQRRSVLVDEPGQIVVQHRKAPDVPVVGDRR